MKGRERWRSRIIFIMASLGSAVGLGNIWRFSYVAVNNGGGAFLLPYAIALLSAGIPVMILEYGLGCVSQRSLPFALAAIRRPLRFVGWIAIFAAFAVCVYYAVILSWTGRYLVHAVSINEWAGSLESSRDFLLHHVLKASSSPWQLNELNLPLLGGLVIVWAIIWLIIRGGLKRLGKVLLFTVPLPLGLLVILALFAARLPGAVEGLNFYLVPEWDRLLDPAVWLAAYGQVFFSLSIGFGVMVAFASFMPSDTEITNSAAITSFANSLFSFLAGFAVFSVLGYFAASSHFSIEDLTVKGVGMSFMVFPVALAKLPHGPVFAVLFFLTLFTLGIDSAFSLVETVATAISEQFGIRRPVATGFISLAGFITGIPLITGAGMHWIGIIDHFVMNYVVTVVVVVECIAVAWLWHSRRFVMTINHHSDIPLGIAYHVLVRVFTPLMITVIFVLAVIAAIRGDHSGLEHYPLSARLIIGGGAVVLIILFAALLSRSKPKSGAA